MNENDLFIPKDFDTFEPEKCSVQTNKNVNLLDMSTAWKRLSFFLFCLFVCFFQVKDKYCLGLLSCYYDTWSPPHLDWVKCPRGTHLKMGYRHVWPERPLFHALLAVGKTPFHHVLVLKTQLSASNHKFLKILNLYKPNSVQKPKMFAKNLVHKATFCSEIQFRRVPDSAVFSSSGAQLYLNKSWVPPPGLQEFICFIFIYLFILYSG